MLCIKCKHDTKVADSRPQKDTIRRTRVCLACKNKFRTIEILEPVVEPEVKPEPLPKAKPRKRQLKPRIAKPMPSTEVEPDFDEMTDEEIEAYIFREV
jgi:transcriptional regulator NrdR family protein